MTLTIFDCLKEIITNKTGELDDHPEFDRTWSNYMIVRYLSMDSKYQSIVESMNRLQTVFSKQEMYRYLLKAIPFNKNSFIPYISKSKKKVESSDESDD